MLNHREDLGKGVNSSLTLLGKKENHHQALATLL